MDDVLDVWDELIPKPSELEPEMVNNLILLASDLPVWATNGQNDKIREAVKWLYGEVRRSDGPRSNAFKSALMLAEAISFEVDDPEFYDEPLVFRRWRTIDSGYTIMDAKLEADPDFKAYPRLEYSIRYEK